MLAKLLKGLFVIFVMSTSVVAQEYPIFIKKRISGIERLSQNNAVAVADYDLDGHLDFYVVARQRYEEKKPETWSRLFKNNNNATFEDITPFSGLSPSYTHQDPLPRLPAFYEGEVRNGAAWGDYDNDGDPDLFLTNYKYNKFYRNNGDGTFSDITEIAGLDNKDGCYFSSAAWIDYNNDGLLDLTVSVWGLCTDNKLYTNNGDGTFADDSEKIKINNREHTWMMLPIDVNDDQWIDLFVVNDFDENTLLINHNGNFSDSTAAYNLLANSSENHMGTAYGDVNNDGLLDIFISDINKNNLWINRGKDFSNEAEALDIDSTDWSWQTRFGDMDLDGDLDITVINGYSKSFKNFYLQNDLSEGKLSFSDRSEESGFAELSNSMCFEQFDYDHDGDIDVLVTQIQGTPFFLENQTADNNPENAHWVKIDLEGTVSNRSAIGTHILIETQGGKQQQAYYTGVGFKTQSMQPTIFGLGNETMLKKLVITWPRGIQETYTDLPVDRIIKAKEGEGYILKTLTSEKIAGCTDPSSCSYNPLATVDDGSCTYLETNGDINGPEQSGLLKVEKYSFPIKEGNSAKWTVSGGHIVSGHGSATVEVQWGLGFSRTISVREIGVCFSEEISKKVDILSELRSEKHSLARLWNETLLDAIRRDYARPTVHARNLFHTSLLMYDLFALYSGKGEPFLEYPDLEGLKSAIGEKEPEELQLELEEAISYGMFRLIRSRFAASPGRRLTEFYVFELMRELGFSISKNGTDYSSGESNQMGSYVAQQIMDYGLTDGSSENEDYTNRFYVPANSPLVPNLPGNPVCEDPNRWQPLKLAEFIDQSGNVIGAETPAFLGAEWGSVKGFALNPKESTLKPRNGHSYRVFHDPGVPPQLSFGTPSATDEFYKWGFSLVSVWGSHLDPKDGVLWDISPNSIGNIQKEDFPRSWEEYPNFYALEEGGDKSKGWTINPITGNPYEEQLVPRGDYTRVLAEFWADGPDSETPPGHWFTILNYVNDRPELVRRINGKSEPKTILEWDIKSYFMLGGAVHDAAIAAWSIKGWYDYIRPISAIRYMAGKGQSTAPGLASYNPNGIPLIDDYIELVQEGDLLAGTDKEHLGKIKVRTWIGHSELNSDNRPKVDWILAENWWPYQRPSFVTPPFAGYVSGHSTFSRAAAEVLTLLTGSEFFPGGLGEFTAPKDAFLVFEKGPSVDVTLQWATYRDAADQCSLSRIWGGIHPPADDIPGRIIGEKVGIDAFAKALVLFHENLNFTPDIEEPLASVEVYPNPVEKGNRIQVKGYEEGETIRLFSLQGKGFDIKYQYQWDSKEYIIDLGSRPGAGLYFLTIGNTTIKIVIH